MQCNGGQLRNARPWKNRWRRKGGRRLTEAYVEDLWRQDDAAGDGQVHHADGVHGLGQHLVHVAEDDGAQAPERVVVALRRAGAGAVEERAEPRAALALRRRRLRLAPRQERPARHQPRQRGHAVGRRRRRGAARARARAAAAAAHAATQAGEARQLRHHGPDAGRWRHWRRRRRHAGHG